jgi:hypothetical protein
MKTRKINHWSEPYENHAGIALLAQDYSIGEQVRAILEFIVDKTAEDMPNQLGFLSKYVR